MKRKSLKAFISFVLVLTTGIAASPCFAQSPQFNEFDLNFIAIGITKGASKAQAFEKLGYYYSQQGEHKDDKKAVICFRQAIKLDPKLHHSWFALGLNRMEHPEPYFKKVLALKPNYAEAYYWLASYYLRAKRISESIQYFKGYLGVVDNSAPTEQSRIKTAKFDIQQMEKGITDYDVIAENQINGQRA